VYDVSATLEYFNKKTLSTVLMRDNFVLSVASKKWVSEQVLVSTYRYKTILGCDPQKMRTTIPNEEDIYIALKHSSLDSQLKTSAALSLSLDAQSEWNSWFYTDWQPVVRYWIEGRRRVFI